MSGPLAFTKMSGAGNDFIVLTGAAWESLTGDRAAWISAVCRRGLSVGADGVLVVAAAGDGRVRVDYFNSDGGSAFCGNGSRCAARFARHRGLAGSDAMTLATAAGDVPAVVTGERVLLTLPPPVDRGALSVSSGAERVHGRWIVAGVPHLVVPVEGLAAQPLARLGPWVRRHPALGPDGANLDLVEQDGEGRVHVRTYERGVENETLACGTGAVAAAFAARIAGAPASVTVIPASGVPLSVTIEGTPAHPRAALLEGDARFIFEGVLAAS